MGIRDRLRTMQEAAREKQVERQAASTAAEAQKQELRQKLATELKAAEAAARVRYQRQVLGDDLSDIDVSTPADAKLAIKLARLRKKEIQAEKRELASELADVREEWRGKTAGRISTVGLGRGTSGRMVRGAIQVKRRSEKMGHADVVNEFSDRRQDLDRQIMLIDRLIADMERRALG